MLTRGAIAFVLALLAPCIGHGAETVPIPPPDTRPAWDEKWAHPEAATALPGFEESLGPLELEPPETDAAGERVPIGTPKPGEADALFSALSGPGDDQPAAGGVAQSIDVNEALAKARRQGTSIDFQLELGMTVAGSWWDWDHFALDDLSFISNPAVPLFFRARTGLLILKEPWYLGIGPTVSYGGVGEWAVGGQVEVTSIWGGVWGQAEMAWRFDANDLVASIAAGYQLVGVEVRASDGGRDLAVIAKVRAPIGLIVFVRGFLDKQERGGAI